MATVNEWINADPRRRAPEFDFGTQWTREHDPNTEWAVTYNTGTGELYARTRIGDDIEVLGQFADPQDVTEAVPEWGRRSMQAGSLDWIRRELPALQQRDPDVDVDPDGSKPIYGVAISVDGDTTVLREPQSIGDVAVRLDAPALDVARVNTGDRTDRVVMWVDDHGHENHLPVNAAATQLYGTGWPIVGDAVVVSDDQSPLAERVLDQLGVDPDETDLERAPAVALEWEDRHRDLERSERELGVDIDIDDQLDHDEIDRGVDDQLDRYDERPIEIEPDDGEMDID